MNITQPVQSDAPARRRRTRWLAAVYGCAVVAAAAIGATAGHAAGASHNASYQQTIASLRLSNTTLRQQLGQAQNQAVSAWSKATAQAQAQAKSDWQARMKAAASAQGQAKSALAQARSDRGKAAALLGQLQASRISADGVYVVGSDIKAGTWHTPGGGQCYYALLTGSTNTSDVANIADNNNFSGDETVSLGGVYAFQISGGCSWYRTG